MKLVIEQTLECSETEIKIRCGLMDERLKRLIEQIRQYSFSIAARNDDGEAAVPLEEIYYFDSVDNQTFLYKETETYKCDKKLYELEQMLSDTPFVRISKNCILNTNLVSSVRGMFGGRMEAILKNGEKVIISKHYLTDFRKKFEL